MALQNSVNLNINRYFAGQIQDAGNPNLTRSAAWAGTQETGDLFGKMLKRGSQPYEAVPVTTGTTIKQLFGILENDMLHQNGIAPDGVTILPGEALSIAVNATITMRTDGSAITQGVDLYIILADSTTPANVGCLTSSTTLPAADRLLVGGPTFTSATDFIMPYDHITANTDKFVTVRINNI